MQKTSVFLDRQKKEKTIPRHNKPLCEGELKMLLSIFNDVVAKLRLTLIRTWPASLVNEVYYKFKNL